MSKLQIYESFEAHSSVQDRFRRMTDLPNMSDIHATRLVRRKTVDPERSDPWDLRVTDKKRRFGGRVLQDLEMQRAVVWVP